MHTQTYWLVNWHMYLSSRHILIRVRKSERLKLLYWRRCGTNKQAHWTVSFPQIVSRKLVGILKCFKICWFWNFLIRQIRIFSWERFEFVDISVTIHYYCSAWFCCRSRGQNDTIRCDTMRYDTRCYFNVRSKANMSQLNIPHGNRQLKV